MIVLLAVGLLRRSRGGPLHAHARGRKPWQAFAIGLVHGMGGTAGVGLLLLSTIQSRTLAVVALALFATCTAISMTILSAGFGAAMRAESVRSSFHRVAPVFGVVSLAFGVWYALGAQGVVPYML